MIVVILKTVLVCPKCGYKEPRELLGVMDRLERIYPKYIRPNIKKCYSCREATLVLKSAIYTVRKDHKILSAP
jgi:hypothetical protein